jgi:hypothetical protein
MVERPWRLLEGNETEIAPFDETQARPAAIALHKNG